MQNHYSVLSVSSNATKEEVQAAFDELLAVRRARKSKTSDIVAAFTVLSDTNLRRAYDLSLFGASAADKLVRTKDAAIVVASQVREAVPDVDLQEVVRSMWQAGLRAVVLTTGVTAKVADASAFVSRLIQAEASKRIDARG